MANKIASSASATKAEATTIRSRPSFGPAARSRDRLDGRLWIPLASIEEALIVDDRPSLTSAPGIENKLIRILGDSAVPLSQLRSRRLASHR